MEALGWAQALKWSGIPAPVTLALPHFSALRFLLSCFRAAASARLLHVFAAAHSWRPEENPAYTGLSESCGSDFSGISTLGLFLCVVWDVQTYSGLLAKNCLSLLPEKLVGLGCLRHLWKSRYPDGGALCFLKVNWHTYLSCLFEHLKSLNYFKILQRNNSVWEPEDETQ